MNKICTSLEQSKKLMELGIDVNTADMHYSRVKDEEYDWTPLLSPIPKLCAEYIENIPAWSLAALLQYLREVDFFPEIEVNKTDIIMKIFYYEDDSNKLLIPIEDIIVCGETFIDAAVELIIKIKENGKI